MYIPFLIFPNHFQTRDKSSAGIDCWVQSCVSLVEPGLPTGLTIYLRLTLVFV